MRVLILSQWYYPEPVPKPQELAEALAERGHTVSVITGFPNYPEGKLYTGWKLGFRRREIINEIPVTRMYEYPYHGKNSFRRVLNYISFMLTAPFGLIGTQKFDVIYVWHPPLTVGVARNHVVSTMHLLPNVGWRVVFITYPKTPC